MSANFSDVDSADEDDVELLKNLRVRQLMVEAEEVLENYDIIGGNGDVEQDGTEDGEHERDVQDRRGGIQSSKKPPLGTASAILAGRRR